MEARKLYGGAIEGMLPSIFVDVSDLRPVPDHQEVHLDPNNDTCIIVELLDMDTDHGDGEGAIRHQFAELSSHNESLGTRLLGDAQEQQAVQFSGTSLVPSLPAECTRYGIMGIQHVQKHHSPSAPVETVIVIMILIRLPQVTTDLVITLNIPVPEEVITTQGQVFQEALLALTPNIVLSGANVSDTYASLLAYLPQIEVMRRFLDTFRIVDWSLFG